MYTNLSRRNERGLGFFLTEFEVLTSEWCSLFWFTTIKDTSTNNDMLINSSTDMGPWSHVHTVTISVIMISIISKSFIETHINNTSYNPKNTKYDTK